MMRVWRSDPLQAYRHWLVAMLIAFALTAVEVSEHWPIVYGHFEYEFVAEVLLMGIVFPLVGGAALGWLDQLRARRTAMAKRAAPCVLVVENELLGGLVKHLLSKEPGLHVIGAAPQDAAALLDAIRQTRPDVVVMDQNVGLATPVDPADLPEDLPNLRFVTMNAENERARVQDIRQVRVTGKRDLVTLMRGG